MSDFDIECYSESDYIKQHVELADKSLKDLAILRHDNWPGGGLVIVGKPSGSSCYRCEIVLVPSGHIILTGDLDTMVWGRWNIAEGGVREAIRWMARSDVSYYVRQKASIGMNNIGCEQFELPVAIWEAREYLRDAQRDECSSAEKWKKIVAKLESEDEEWTQDSVTELLYTTLCDCDIPNIGMVPSQRLLWAWSLLRRADALFHLREA
ncbi:MAG: hypothetical protein WC565_03955 [Parcubacteria group bacterium]